MSAQISRDREERLREGGTDILLDCRLPEETLIPGSRDIFRELVDFIGFDEICSRAHPVFMPLELRQIFLHAENVFHTRLETGLKFFAL